MKTIVCYGDSNTYGYNPHNSLRYDESLIWPSLLQEAFKDDYLVYNEGLNGRTTAYDREGEDVKNGLKKLVPTLDKYNKIDILIFMLGTNDCNFDLYLSVDDIVEGMEKLLISSRDYLLNKQGFIPNTLIIVPAGILKDIKGTTFEYQLDESSVYKSKAIAKPYKELAEKYGCLYLDCSNCLEVSSVDCEHLTVNGHRKLAELVYQLIK